MGDRGIFAFVREGTSDDGLIPHLRELLVRSGLSEAVGSPRDYKGTVRERIESVVSEEAEVDIIFVHRDADSPSDEERRNEIGLASAAIAPRKVRVVPVVPIQELEAWLLLDEELIRRVAGKPSGKKSLNLPKLKSVEGTSSPKEILEQALIAASESKGRRLKNEKRQFSYRRRVLLERLDIDGPITQLAAWQMLVRDIERAVDELQAQ